jgi:hypothetical protein
MKKTRTVFYFSSAVLITAAVMIFGYLFQVKEKFKYKQEIRAKLAQIPLEERQYLEEFFRFIISKVTFGYVLFGDKPMSLHDFLPMHDIPSHYLNSYWSMEAGLEYCRMQKGIETWKKYRHLFPINKYLFLIKDPKYPPSIKEGKYPEVRTAVFLINKTGFEQIVKKYQQDFSKVVKRDINAKELLDCFTDADCNFSKKLRRHPALLGILLGYGRDNAWLYHRWIESKRNVIHLLERARNLSAMQVGPIVLASFAELPYLGFSEPILLPSFFCDPKSAETKELWKKYTSQRSRMVQEYLKGDFLEITLQKLTE